MGGSRMLLEDFDPPWLPTLSAPRPAPLATHSPAAARQALGHRRGLNARLCGHTAVLYGGLRAEAAGGV
jgi:hypothetical protein